MPAKDGKPCRYDRIRFIETLPIGPQHFLSDVETNKRNHDPSNCSCWGCSVWPTLAAAEHGRKIFYFFRKGYVVAGQLIPSDGETLPTPSAKQPDHVTFWKDQRVDVSHKFSVVLKPLVKGA